jgi:hypothetical protein
MKQPLSLDTDRGALNNLGSYASMSVQCERLRVDILVDPLAFLESFAIDLTANQRLAGEHSVDYAWTEALPVILRTRLIPDSPLV